MTETRAYAELRDNKDQRTPIAIIVDGSSAMRNFGVIDALNRWLKRLEEALKADETASTGVRVMIVRFGDDGVAEVLTEWTDAMNFEAPTVVANGNTPMGKAVDLAMARIEDEKRAYHANAISYRRPWLFLMSGGQPDDEGWELVADRCRQAQAEKRLVLVPAGVGEGPHKRTMEMFSGDARMVPLKTLDIESWLSGSLPLRLSQSVSMVSVSSPGEPITLPPIGAWGKIT